MKNISKKIIQLKTANEESILSGIRNGNPESFRMLYELYSKRIYKLAFRYMEANEEAAQSIVQETFLAVFKNINKFREESSLGSWIYRIAINICLKELVKNKRDQNTMQSWTEIEASKSQETEHPTETLIRQQTYDFVLKCIHEMDKKKRMTFLLYYFEDMTTDDIAHIMNERRTTVLKRLQRIREELTNKIKENEAFEHLPIINMLGK